jgi:hypothetical protein
MEACMTGCYLERACLTILGPGATFRYSYVYLATDKLFWDYSLLGCDMM